ncbi:GMC family oxidoreductase N-terminal domain-containing protein [Amorphoplanes nipponensis]|uniref:GMC family oxidoreductase n=1 Tax=Actinoplanes nipponensis TaxID=135950 RepID=A0A919MP62_9ACTN|nr:GMC family oxidoreductase N-terminal domain-containing protein [Actinoplanes nipponensis]GIE51712.1 GMC family oxidoreductase [Actinoplanes nipponensis]
MAAQPAGSTIPRTADVVIVGAGAAGAVLAARLAAAGAGTVLLVEAGPDYRSADTPAAVRGTDVSRALAVRALRWPGLRARLTGDQPLRPYVCGRGAGGSSAINGQLAVRGPAADFRAWVDAGLPDWGWPEVLPAFAGLERDPDFGDRPGHGSSGPVTISRAAADRRGPLSAAFAAAAKAAGHPEHPDLNAAGSTGLSPTAWHRRDGTRVSSNDSHLEPARHEPRLHVAGDHTVSRVLFSAGRVRGVELITGSGRELVSAPAVVLCAGAVHSPAILMRSGVGPPEQLGALGIEVVAGLPGVGAVLSDHPAILLELRLTDAAAARARETESGCFLVRLRSGPQAGPADDIQLLPLDRTVGPAAAGLLVSLMRPVSVGSLRLGGADPAADPVLDLGLLTERADLDRLAAAVRHAADLLAGPALRGTIASAPALPDGDLGRWLRENCRPQYHPSGTCRMGPPDDPATVVDQEGRVLGVDGLWVADASVLPLPCGAPPYLTTVMLAERLAAAVRRRLGQGR